SRDLQESEGIACVNATTIYNTQKCHNQSGLRAAIGKALFVIQYRTFRNPDPPAMVEIWNQSFINRGAFRLQNSALLEICVFSKPYFDPAGLMIAEDKGKLVGFAHAGFGPNAPETDIVTDFGIICAIAVLPSHRGQGIGTELLRRCEDY